MTTEHGHFRKVCACGLVLEQCRCPGPKHETVVAPCRHQDKVVEDPKAEAKALVDRLIAEGRIRPEQRDYYVELRMMDEGLFESLIPVEPVMPPPTVQEPVGPAYVDIAGRLHARATPDGKLEVYVDLEEDGDIPATRVSMTMDAGGGLTLLNELAVALRALSLAYPNPPPKP